MFNDEYVDSLPHDPLLALERVLDDFFAEWNNIPPDEDSGYPDLFLKAYAIARPLERKVGSIFVNNPDLSAGQVEAIRTISVYLKELRDIVQGHVFELKAANYINRYEAMLGGSFVYEFSEGDIKRIQKLINELRDVISGSIDFETAHKARLLSRLEKVQTELHKKMADLDRFWGLIGDAGVAIGSFATTLNLSLIGLEK